jgi:hypothetical protein
LDIQTEKDRGDAEIVKKLKQLEFVDDESPTEPMTATEAGNDEAYENRSDSEEFKVFYNPEQTKATVDQQNADLFQEIVTQIKHEQKEDHQSLNLVQIKEFTQRSRYSDQVMSGRDKPELALIQKDRHDH